MPHVRTHPWTPSTSTPRNHQPSADTAAVITIAAATDIYHIIEKIKASYNGVPTGGKLTVAIGGTEVLDIDITDDGPVEMDFGPDGLYDRTGSQAVVITLAAGGSGITGKLFALTR